MSKHIGQSGEKIQTQLKFVRTIETQVRAYGYYNRYETKWGHVFETATGDVVMWWTASTSLSELNPGDQVKAQFTVKKHTVYREVAQTQVTRLKITEQASAPTLQVA